MEDYSQFLKSSEKKRKECQESCTEFVFGMGESRVMFRLVLLVCENKICRVTCYRDTFLVVSIELTCTQEATKNAQEFSF